MNCRLISPPKKSELAYESDFPICAPSKGDQINFVSQSYVQRDKNSYEAKQNVQSFVHGIHEANFYISVSKKYADQVSLRPVVFSSASYDLSNSIIFSLAISIRSTKITKEQNKVIFSSSLFFFLPCIWSLLVFCFE